ncbi:MAG: PglZ domain-containing protein [Planctomycetaceae bacterium]
MNPLHEYIARQLSEHLTKQRIVVFYDPRNEFTSFIGELEAGENATGGKVSVGNVSAALTCYEGSFFAIRAKVEPIVAQDQPEPLLIYIPGIERDRKGSVLMELELAGTCYEPQLKRLARHVLTKRYTDGVIDEMLAPEKVTYSDILSFMDQGTTGGTASLLKVIFSSARNNAEVIAAWLTSPDSDQVIQTKEALPELLKLLEHRLGLKFDAAVSLDAMRSRTLRHVLINEFRDDLSTEAPSSLQIVPPADTPEQLALARDVAEALRAKHADPYIELADGVEQQFALGKLTIAAEHLGRIDTFRFEEQALLKHSYALIAEGKFTPALTIVTERERGFWVRHNLDRQLQWAACQAMAELGSLVQEVGGQLSKMNGDAAAWVAAYTADKGWHRADSTQRNLEALLVQIDEEPASEPALNRVRQAYEELLQRMAVTFSQTLQNAHWTIPNAFLQTHIYPELVERAGSRVAYFLVDALRFEMGVELKKLLEGSEDLVLRPAIAALPTITPIGMAALLPRAAATFDVVDHQGALASRIEGVPLKDLSARMKFLKARVPGAIDIELGKLLQMTSGKLKSAIGKAGLVVVRSQEIDKFGEMDGDFIARQMMDTVLQNVARAVRKLAAAGIESVVISADHGYQFTREKDEAFRTDSPGGDTLDLHRRCWIGRGGANPAGTIRVTGSDLGYDTDLDFIFPTGIGVFKSGGNLAYHHGGLSLQELIVPVLTLRTAAPAANAGPEGEWKLKGVPKELNNRTFGVTIELTSGLFARDAIVVRPVLMAGGEQVGEAGMAIDVPFDREAKTVTVQPGKPATVAMLLRREDCPSIRIAVLDPATDAVLVQSEEITVRLGV